MFIKNISQYISLVYGLVYGNLIESLIPEDFFIRAFSCCEVSQFVYTCKGIWQDGFGSIFEFFLIKVKTNILAGSKN